MAKKIFLRDLSGAEVLPITRGELVLDSSGNPAFHSNEFLATESQPGLMSAEDKKRIDDLENIGPGADSKVAQVNTTTSDVYRLLFSETATDETKTEGARKSAKLTFNPSTGVLQTTALIGNLDGTYINRLTGYTKATTVAGITSEDSLSTALGKLELKADTAYALVAGAYDGDGTIENLAEILKVLEGISDTDTIQAIVGKYLPLAGGMMTGDITFDVNRAIKWHQSGSYSISCPTGSDGAYLLLKAHNGITAKKRLSIYTNAESLPNTNYNLYTDGSLYAASAVFGGNTKITNGSDLTLQASSGAQGDAGDIVFSDYSGAELGRIWCDSTSNQQFSLRYGANGATSRILHSRNYNSYAPTLTGTGATGTWGINISGDAATLGGNKANAFAKNLNNSTDFNIDDKTYGLYGGKLYNCAGTFPNPNVGYHYGAFLAFGYEGYEVQISSRAHHTWLRTKENNEASAWKQLAFVEDIPTVTNYYWADQLITSSAKNNATPTFGNTTIKSGTDAGLAIHTSDAYSRIRFYNAANENKATIHYFATGYFGYTFAKDTLNLGGVAITIGDWNNPTMYITPKSSTTLVKGCVGIGTTTPTSSLHVNGNTLLKEISIDAGWVSQHTPSTSGWYTIARVSGYFNFDLFITGGWNYGMPSCARVNICNIEGTSYITQLAGYIGNHCKAIRLGKVNKNAWDVQVYIETQSGPIGRQVCSFVGWGELITYTTSTIATTTYTSTNELYFSTMSGTLLTSDSGDSRYVNITGDTMTGDLTFSPDSAIKWSRNTDYASIRFINTGGSDTNSYLDLQTGDNGNEYIRLSRNSGGTTYEMASFRADEARINGTLRITPQLGNYQEGIRIQPKDNWSILMLLGADTTAATSGTSAKSWGLFNNDGNFYINRNSSNGNTGYELCNVNGKWGIGTVSPIQKLHVEGAGVFKNTSSTTYTSDGITIGAGDATRRYITCYGKTGDSYINFGYTASEKNCGELMFHYAASGNDGNYSALSLYGASNTLYVYPTYTKSGKYIQAPNYVATDNGYAYYWGASKEYYLGSNTTDDFYFWSTSSSARLRIGTKNLERMTVLSNGCVGINITSPNEILHINGNFKIQGTSNTSTKPDVYLGYYTSWQGGTYPTLMSGYTSKWIMHFNPHICKSDSTDMPGSNIRMQSTSSNYYDLSVAYDGNDYFRLRYNNNKNLITVTNNGKIYLSNGIIFTGEIGLNAGTYIIGDSTALYLAANETNKKVFLESTNQSCPYFRNKNGDYAIYHEGNVSDGYVMHGYTIDASGLNSDTWYPVTFYVGAHANVRIECRVSLNSGTRPSWSTHENGFSVRKIWETNGSGWGTNPVSRRILVSNNAFVSNDPVRGIGQLTNSSHEYVYVRGGGKYYFYTSHNITPTLHTSDFTQSNQTVPVTTSTPEYINVDVGATSTVYVNNSDHNSTYRMVWHSGSSLYGTGGIYCNPSTDSIYATHFYETSDINLKKNIKAILDSNNIPVIKEFDWKSDGTHSYGLIAQELEEQGYSELVSDSGSHKTVNYSAALSLIVGKLQNKIKELEAEIENLKLRA